MIRTTVLKIIFLYIDSLKKMEAEVLLKLKD